MKSLFYEGCSKSQKNPGTEPCHFFQRSNYIHPSCLLQTDYIHKNFYFYVFKLFPEVVMESVGRTRKCLSRKNPRKNHKQSTKLKVSQTEEVLGKDINRFAET